MNTTAVPRRPIPMRVGNGSRAQRGLTLVELLVVISIIALLLSLLIPAVQSARESARQVTCRNNIRQIALATLNYVNVNADYLPSHRPYVFDLKGKRRSSTIGWGREDNCDAPASFGWMVTLLPYLEQQNLHDRFDFTKNLFTPSNKSAAQTMLSFTQCPSTPGYPTLLANFTFAEFTGGGEANISPPERTGVNFPALDYQVPYAVSVHNRVSANQDFFGIGAFGNGIGHSVSWTQFDDSYYDDTPAPVSFSEIWDGYSQTVLVSEQVGYGSRVANERYAGLFWFDPHLIGAWANQPGAHPGFYDVDGCCVNRSAAWEPESFHPGKAFIAMADGSVRGASASGNGAVLAALFTKNSAEPEGAKVILRYPQ